MVSSSKGDIGMQYGSPNEVRGSKQGLISNASRQGAEDNHN